MDSRSKSSVVSAFILVFYLLIVVGSLAFSDNINPILFIMLAQLVLSFWYIPKLNKGYKLLRVDDVEDEDFCKNNILDYIPIFNETRVISPWCAILAILLIVVDIIFIALLFFPDLLVILGENFVFTADEKIPRLAIILVMLTNIVLGIGQYGVLKYIEEDYNYYVEGESYSHGGFIGALKSVFKYIPFLQGLLLMLPILKILPIIMTIDKLEIVLKFKGEN